ncbi:MAG: riboflavin synthase [Planctomycetota bacterium]
MFTGIIEGMAPLVGLEVTDRGARLMLDLGEAAEGVQIGDSVALDGCCLTVTTLAGSRARFDAVPETLSRTTLGERRVGERVNYERALRLGDRLGGHLVSGHIDCVGKLRAVTTRGLEADLEFEVPAPLRRLLIPKGSIAVDGISLTIARLTSEGFGVAVIPHTWKATTLAAKKPSDRVNLEMDLLGKWVERLLTQGRVEGGLSLEDLARAGFTSR